MGRHLTRHLRPYATKTLVIYSKATGVRRRTVDADHDYEYRAHIENLHPGEGYFFLSHEEYDSHKSPHELNHTTAVRAGFAKAPEYEDGLHEITDRRGRVVGHAHCDLTCGDTGEHFGPGHRLRSLKKG